MSQESDLLRALSKDEVTILITDSGLGGLAVVADIERTARERGAYRSMHLVFANALPEKDQGYNGMPSNERRAGVFSDALRGMVDAYKPDVVLIACNTLSVVYPGTEFSKTSHKPVVGIVELGVDMLGERMSGRHDVVAVLFGTETTIASDEHRARFAKIGLPATNIVTQACPGLAGEIELESGSDRVRTAIDLFALEAASKVTSEADTIIAGLCCTHYGYCADAFANSLSKHTGKPVEIADPTTRMAGLVFPPGREPTGEPSVITIEVVSRARISDAEIASIGGLLERVSHQTAEALRRFTLKRDLFRFSPN